MSTPFVFSSARLLLNKAKQLQKAFPFLKLSAAQEATARALGYSSRYECSKLGTQGRPSLTDEDAGLPTRVERYYHQASVLTGLGITPPDADLWVRAWGLTGKPTLAPGQGAPAYYSLLDVAQRIERGELSQEELNRDWGEADWSKHPDIDRPVRVCEGVVLAPSGKYPHYYVDPGLLARVPAYVRGSASAFHYEDEGGLLSEIIPGFALQEWDRPFAERLNIVQHEWHFGHVHPDASGSAVEALCSEAMKVPRAMVVISVRCMPLDLEAGRMGNFALACLRGVDFAAFIQRKGEIDASKVVWYRDIAQPPGLDMYGWLVGMSSELVLPVFEGAGSHKPALPVYSYPFKDSPMAADEYDLGLERCPLLALELDYDSDEGDDDDGDGSDGPLDPSLRLTQDDKLPA